MFYTYTYDELNRLKSWNNGSATKSYAYDTSGKPLSMQLPATNKTYYFHFNAHDYREFISISSRPFAPGYIDT